MGCGKSTLGKKVATKTGYSFVDLDELIVQKIHMSISEYFETYGEAAFREIERETLHSLYGSKDTIVATGGGTPCHLDNMEWMNKNGKTVYLKIPPKALLSRLSQKDIDTRPLLKGKNNEELLAFIESKLEERSPFYNQARIIFDVLQSNPKDLIKQIVL
jgi:shikimate kinase